MSSNSENSTVALMIAKAAVRSLDSKLVSIEFIDAGSTSEVFLIETSQSKYVLKVAQPNPNKMAAYISDAAIRSALLDLGYPVAEPIATNHSMPVGANINWALDRHCQGYHPQRGLIRPAISRQLGRLLRALHNLPAKKFGLLENTDMRLQGQHDNAIAGLHSRFESPWPFSSKSLQVHPAIKIMPALKLKLLSIKDELTQFPLLGKIGVVHGDLHEAQLLVNQSELVALLDFNEAMAGRPEWDLGSYYYFHGKRCLYDLLEGYTDDKNTRSQLAKEALFGAILIALHHGNRGEKLGKPHRISACAQFLGEALN